MPSPKALLTRARDKRPFLDHLVRAGQRYMADTGDRLAAAVTFFGFLSFFPLLALSASLLALFYDNAAVTVAEQVDAFSPGLADQLGLVELLEGNQQGLGLAGLASLGGLLFAGLGWIDAMREAIRTVWHQNVKAGNFFKKKAVDVVILAGLGATLIFSLLVSAAAGAFTDVALDLVGLERTFVAGALITVLGTVLALFTSTLLFLYLFIRLPKVQTPWREIVKGALLAAVLFEVLKRVGAVYIERTTDNPLYGIFAVVVGLLVWINLVSRMLLFCAAWTVTAPYDSDVKPSGTADPEQARKAGIPQEFADDDDPDHVPAVQADGAPSPLLAALQGATPPQDVPEGPPSRQEPAAEAARRAADAGHPETGGSADASDGRGDASASSSAGPVPPAQRQSAQALPGEAATRRAAQVGAAAITAGAVGVGLYALKTVVGVFRR